MANLGKEFYVCFVFWNSRIDLNLVSLFLNEMFFMSQPKFRFE